MTSTASSDVPVVDSTTTTTTTPSNTNTNNAEDQIQLKKNIADRLLFFFSNANIRQDSYMRKYCFIKEDGNSSNNNNKTKRYSLSNTDPYVGTGMVPIKAGLCKFHTIQQYTTSIRTIIDATVLYCSDTLKVIDGTTSTIVTTIPDDDDKSSNTYDNYCIQRVTPFTKQLLYEHVDKSLLITNVPIDETTKKYCMTITDVQSIFEPILKESSGTTNDTTAAKIELIKFQYQPSSTTKDDDGDVATTPTQTKGSPVKWIPNGMCMIEFDTIDHCEMIAKHVVTTSTTSTTTTTTTTSSTENGDDATSQPPIPLYYDPPATSSKAVGEKVQLQIMLYSEYHKNNNNNKDGKKSYTNGTNAKINGSSNNDNDDDKKLTNTDGATEEVGTSATTTTTPSKGESKFTIDWKPGCVISLKGIRTTSAGTGTGNDNDDASINCDRECLLELIVAALNYNDTDNTTTTSPITMQDMKEQQLVYIDYSRGQDYGAIRFNLSNSEEDSTYTDGNNPSALMITNDSIQKVYNLLLQQLVIAEDKKDNNVPITTMLPNPNSISCTSITILSGDEETEYWNTFITFKNQQIQKHANEKSKSHDRNNSNNHNSNKRKSNYNNNHRQHQKQRR